MKKRTIYRVFLYEGANNLCEQLALIAVRSNGDTPVTMDMLEMLAKSGIKLNPKEEKNTTAELIGNNLLNIDKKIGDEYKTVLSIEQVEVPELPKCEDDENVVLKRHEILN